MGTASTKKFIKNVSGTLTEEAALTTSAGAGDADKMPALNASGVLDPTIVNAKVVSAGAGDANKIPQLDSNGKLDTSVMPSGIGADTSLITAFEALAAGDLVNIYNNASTANVRKADANTPGKEAHGFVLSAVSASASATVYFEGTNNQVTGLTPGLQFLGIVAGKTQAAAPTGTGKFVQRVGFATSATSMNFDQNDPITLA
jgi:hypothetical protein